MLTRTFLLFLLSAMLFTSGQAAAQIYKWIDANGNTHYGDAKNTPDSVKSNEVTLGDINTLTSVTYDSVATPQDKVVMYAASWCGYCKKARNYFRANSIPYTEYDIEKSRSAAARYQKMGATGVPVILYKDKRMNGFSEAGFRRIYAEDS